MPGDDLPVPRFSSSLQRIEEHATVAPVFGHAWTIATHLKDLSADEMQKAMEQEMSQEPKA